MEYKDFAINLAKQAGEIMLKNFKVGMTKQWKSDNSPVTESDLEINTLLISEIKKHFPTHNVLAEEESSQDQSSEYLWVCDPLDGTIPFAHGIPISTFSLALVKDGKSILGVVYDPFMNRLYYAEPGKGTYLNDQKITISAQRDLYNSTIALEAFSRARYHIDDLFKVLEDKGVKTIKPCSIIYPTALVAAGELLATIFPNDTVHDAAAIKIIVEEAGGKVTDLFGNDQRYDQQIKGFIASNGLVHDQLVDEVEKILK